MHLITLMMHTAGLFLLIAFDIGVVVWTAESGAEWLRGAGAGGEEEVSWCTVSPREQHKCGNLSLAVERDKGLFGQDYMRLACKQAFDAEECMSWVDAGTASVLRLDAGEVFLAGRYHSLVPILQEVYEGGVSYEYSVAVVRSGSAVGATGLSGLRGARACFPGVGTMAGWTLPVHTLMEEGGLQVTDCNNHVKSVTDYFGESCAVNALSDTFNPIGDNSDRLCALCGGGAGRRCTGMDPYAGYHGALRCLLETRADVAFLRHSTVPRAVATPEIFAGLPIDKLELLCKDGSRRPVSDYESCSWGRVPADAVVTSSAHTLAERTRYQRFFQKMIQLYGEPNRLNATQDNTDYRRTSLDTRGNLARYDQYGNPLRQNDEYGNTVTSTDRYYNWNDPYRNRAASTTPSVSYQPVTDASGKRVELFRLLQSARYGACDLLLQDGLVGLRSLSEEQQDAKHVLETKESGPQAREAALGLKRCPVGRATLCVTSDAELNKCVKMKTALKSAFLSPPLHCYRGHSSRLCSRAIADGLADFTLLDAADMVHAAQHHRLVPFMSEVYSNGHDWYYAVAVAKEQDPDTDLTYLRGKNTCHAGISTAAGWVYPLAYLISNGWIRSYGCDGARAASEYFSKSCAPGALSTEYVDAGQGAPRDNLCHLCHGTSFRRCRRDASEDYYGHVGALRCMVEGGGDVAFVRHTGPAEVSGGRRREWWARNLLPDDLQLLCPDGTRAKATEYEHCNLGRVPGSVLVGRANHTELDTYSGLLMYAQQLYGPDTTDEFSFSMFSSPAPYSDLLFSSSAVALRPLPRARRSATLVAGPALPRALRVVDCDAPPSAAYFAADPVFLGAGGRAGWGGTLLAAAVCLVLLL